MKKSRTVYFKTHIFLTFILFALFLFSGRGECWHTSGHDWSGDRTTMSLNLGSAWNGAAEDALYQWSAVPASSFQFYYNNENHDHCDRGTLCIGTDGNAVEWDDFSNGICGDSASDALAITRTNWSTSYCNADVLFNSHYSWTTSARDYTTTPPYNLNSVAIHEFGHALGLNHEDRWLATMNSIYHANAHKIHADDKGGLRHIYGSGGSYIDIALTNWKKQNTSSSIPAALVSSPSHVNTGETISMEWTQENHGTSAVNFDIGFYLSANSTISTSDRLLATNSGASQSRESSSTFSRNVTIPLDIREGTYWLGVYLDYNRRLAEDNEGNNSLAHPRSLFIYDTVHPTPSPMQWDVIPYQTSTSVISMKAVVAADPTPPVSYYFDFVGSPTGGYGGTDSGWVSTTTFNDTGLQANHQYAYRLRARDGASTPNYTGYTYTSYEYTDIEQPSGVTFGTVTTTSINVRSLNTPSGLARGASGLWIECYEHDSSGWKRDNAYWTQSGLLPNRFYYFRAKARNGDAEETQFCDWQYHYTRANTPDPPTLHNPTDTTMDVTINPNENPPYTSCVIGYYENGVFFYVGADGIRNNLPVWQRISTWGTITAKGLIPGKLYCFFVKAKNGDDLETSWSSGSCMSTMERIITVLSPNGGERWYIGDTKNITWESQYVTGDVRIEISRDGGSSWATIANSTPNDGSLTWTITGPVSTSCVVRVTSLNIPSVNDVSNSSFTITEKPPPCHGDFNGDGMVNESDLEAFASHFGRSDCGTGLPCDGDFSLPDGDVDGYDLALFAGDFNRIDCP